MKTIWTSHLNDQDAERFKQTVRSAKSTLDREKDILIAWLNEINSIETNPDIYDKSSWSALQAHYNGEKRAYRRMLQLIDLNQEEDNGRRSTG